jgi:cytochrome c553
MKKITIALLSVPMALFSAAALAGDAAAGAAKAEVCLDCHEAADFEGMSADDIAGKLKGVLAGEVKHPDVELAEADVPDIAAYFAAEAAK